MLVDEPETIELPGAEPCHPSRGIAAHTFV
jgi:hypothetical protein